MRYNEIFDSALIREISESNPATDWEEMGWRGISYGTGEVWVDIDGALLAVNYQSDFEKRKMAGMLAKDRAEVHESLSKFKSLEYVLETKTYRIRIDELSTGNYRYACWKLGKPMSEKPDIIIKNGKLDMQGSGGNHSFDFKNGPYIYQINVIELGEDGAPPARLRVFKRENQLLVEDAQIIGR